MPVGAASGRRRVMAEIIQFMAVPFDYTSDGIVAGEPVRCPSPAAAIEQAQGLWKTFGHAGAIAISRTSDFAIGTFGNRQILRKPTQVPSQYCRALDSSVRTSKPASEAASRV